MHGGSVFILGVVAISGLGCCHFGRICTKSPSWRSPQDIPGRRCSKVRLHSSRCTIGAVW